MRRDNLWFLFDKHAIFGIELRLQAKFVIYSMLACFANATIDSLDTIGYLSVTQPHELHYWHALLLYGFKDLFGWPESLVVFCRVVSQLIFIAGEVFRFYRVTIITYAALCVASHLKILKKLIIQSELQESDQMQQQIDLHNFDDLSAHTISSYVISQSGSVRLQSLSASPSSSLGTLNCSTPTSNANLANNRRAVSIVRPRFVVTPPLESDDGRAFEYPANCATNRRSTLCSLYSLETSLAPPFVRMMQLLEEDQDLDKNKQLIKSYVNCLSKTDGHSVNNETMTINEGNSPKLELNSLQAIESHLKEIDSFISHLDYEEPILVCVMILLIMFLFVQTAFAMTDFYMAGNRKQASLQLICLLIRFFTLLSVFKSCDLVQTSGRKLLVLFERIYLQKYYGKRISKQDVYSTRINDAAEENEIDDYGCTMSSLKRIIKILDGIKFNCDTLLNIDLGTLIRLLLYTIAFMFIVIQYGECSLIFRSNNISS